MERLKQIFSPLLGAIRGLPARDLAQAAWEKFKSLLPDSLRSHAVPVALGAAALLLIVFILVLSIAMSTSGPKTLARRPQPTLGATPLKNYHLYQDAPIADPAVREHILQPEEMPVRQDKNYLEENLRKSRLFNQAELQIQMELNQLSRH
ncbi:MAG: hypothetical protein J0L75_17240 [Spirochaetes bacterium]|nr:hypothetical protein [Spirochaetota bacterium]